MVAVDYGGWAWDTEFNEISRPCLRRVELEVEMSFDDHDAWFSEALEAAYLPEVRFPWELVAGVAVLAVATLACA